MYRAGSVKTMERKRRGCGDKVILKGESTKRLQTGKHSWAMTRTSSSL